jgi:hypothetical protein
MHGRVEERKTARREGDKRRKRIASVWERAKEK